MNMLRELRDAAEQCSRLEYRVQLKDTAAHLQSAITRLGEDPTVLRMIELNGVWARAASLLKNLPDEADPQPPLAGAPEPARLAA